MVTCRVAVVGAVGLGLAAGVAHADPAPDPTAPAAPDPVALHAGEANLEPVGRHGIIVSGALQGATVIGFGSRGDTGLGGMFSLRLGKVASPTWNILLEIQGGAIAHQPLGGDLSTNQQGELMVGAQHYVAPSFWLRGGLGWGSYVRENENVQQPGGAKVLVAREVLAGVVDTLGVGVDLVRWRYATLAVEGSTSMLIHKHGATTMSGFGLGLTF